MKELKSILTIKEKTPDLLLLEVKEGSQIDLIAHGFDGDEKLFRLQKSGYNRFFTSFHGDELKPSGTFQWGNSCTCASDSWILQRNQIVDVAKQAFGFDMK